MSLEKLIDLAGAAKAGTGDVAFWDSCTQTFADLGVTGIGYGIIPYASDATVRGFTQAGFFRHTYPQDWVTAVEEQALVDDEPLPLTAFEYRILEYLMRHQQQVVAKERLMEQLYPDDNERDANVIEVLVGRLRRKLEAHGGLKPIDTVRGLGYLFTERCR